MRRRQIRTTLLGVVLVTLAVSAAGPDLRFGFVNAIEPAPKDSLSDWKHSGMLTLLTTPDGANLPATAVVNDFPVLVRLHHDWFAFAQARPDGADVRFTSAEGVRLAHQIEEWDAKAGAASIWVRVPEIKGNSRQSLRMYWGKDDATSLSDGKAVFNESNGYLGVWHMGAAVSDDVGVLATKDVGTTPAKGVIGGARRFDGKARIECGDKIANLPTGDSPHTTEVWFRPEVVNTTLVGWGNDRPQGKVVMQFRGPPHVRMDCWFSGANVESTGLIAMNEWVHVAHVCRPGDSRLYVNGVLAGVSSRKDSPLKIASPAGLWIGNWRNQGQFKGDLDEVRVSKVARSAEWMRLQYENQKPLQTLVGPLVSAGNEFSVKAESATVHEGGSVRVTAKAGGAQKLTWSVVKGDREQVLAVDRYTLEFAPGRVTGDTPMKLRLKAVFPDEVKTRDFDLTVKETVPDPEFTLQAPADWDGRKELVLEPQITNLAALKAAGGGATDVRTEWTAGPLAVIKDVVPGKLHLLRSQNSGPLTVTVTLNNGGREVTRSATINVKEPATDAWVHRIPGRNEKPEEGQFYARDDWNEGTLHYKGELDAPADEVFLKVFCDDKPFETVTAKPGKDASYALVAKLKPGLVKYRVEFGTRNGGQETVVDKVGNLLCGDAFLIEGQSNAEALDLPGETPRETSDWVRTYGGPLGRDQDGEAWVRERNRKAGGKQPNLWAPAVWKFKPPEHEAFVGWWGMELGKRLVDSQKVPVCLINGALGGTRIDQHQRNPANPADLSTIYGRWLWRLQQAKLTHGIRAVIWHQGENDQPADGPSGDYGWQNYHRHFVEMAAGWKRDLPNVQHYYAFQIWPNSCAMGGRDGAGDRLRERQRTLPDLFSNLSVMSTLGIRPPGGCHFPMEGYTEFARLIQPLIERDIYGKNPGKSVTPPNLKRVAFAQRDTLTLEFDQPIVWKGNLAGQFYLDGAKDEVASGSVNGSTLTLKLKAPSAAKHITYLKESTWNQDALLVGENGIAALTFCDVPASNPPVADPMPQKAEMAGYLLVPHERVDKSYNAGFSMYVAAWPLLKNYPGQEFQSGLFGTWMFSQYDGKKPEKIYSDIEGGLGWWRDTRFATETPKFIMGGVALNFVEWANGPGAGRGRDWKNPKGHYAIAQLSPWVLWPPDGLNLKQGTNGELFGYGYLPLPLTEAKKTTAGKDVPTGNQCWTLFLNSGNFKGPVTFFVPYFWSKPTVERPELAGLFLDTRPSDPNKAVQMETQHVPAYIAKDAKGDAYARVAPTQFPAKAGGDAPLIHRITAYNRAAMWDGVELWFNGGKEVSGRIDPKASVVHTFKGGGGATWQIYPPNTKQDSRAPLAWNSFATPTALDETTYGYRWGDAVTKTDSLITLPEYYRREKDAKGKERWAVVNAKDVPAETGLAKVEFPQRRGPDRRPYVTPDEADSSWKKPGPAAGPFESKLGDGSTVTYYWYRFADQPTLLNADLTAAEREALQKRVEMLHKNWTKDRDYLPPPTTGKLADLDPGVLVTPPKGLEIGYVPIVTRQGLKE